MRPGIQALRDRIAPAGLKLSSFWWEKSPTRTWIRFGNEMRSSHSLHVTLGATAAELVTSECGRKITGVKCRSLEGRTIVVSRAGVVLAMGGLETPRLLLASDRQLPGGIGNGCNNVGRFYTDHPKHHSPTLKPGPTMRDFASEMQYAPKATTP